MLTRHLSSAAVLIAAALQLGCFPDYFPRKQLKDIAPEQVIGSWKARKATADRFLVYPMPAGSTSTVQFLPDGRCSLHNMIDDNGLFSGDGSWQLAIEHGRGSDTSSRLEITLVPPPAEGVKILTFYFSRVHGKLILWQYVGDPDSAEYIEYERI